MEVGVAIVGDGGREDRSRQENGSERPLSGDGGRSDHSRRWRSGGPQSTGDWGLKDRCLVMEVGRTVVGNGGWEDCLVMEVGRTIVGDGVSGPVEVRASGGVLVELRVSSGCSTEQRRQVRAFGGGLIEVLVRAFGEGEGLRWWSDEAPAVVRRGSGGGPVRLRRWSGEAPVVVRRGSVGGPARLLRWSDEVPAVV
ncbi:hypothetical protein MA16_Dca005095 [Dendrobium catenatum]|uniref:Uncharacterized protein n=1 Tax=Dendrobium catenatum TaxID=906689 RepID=A0A2I0VL78_9ASPA|nr:hypothetical protein MA16_Dca005095 [Dendrobium catenatum]